MKRAMISVSDKTGVVDFAKSLIQRGYEIISTGGTAALLRAEGLAVLEAEEVTGFPECLDGRVKTLHPRIHGGVLARRDNGEHMSTLAKLEIQTIDLICVNLYPFKKTVARPEHTLEEAIENIDIGGPSLLRAGSKNYRFVTVVTDAKDYGTVLEHMEEDGGVPEHIRFALAAKAFQHTAAYDAHIGQYLAKAAGLDPFSGQVTLTYERKQELRYGENPHQKAAWYTAPEEEPAGIAAAEILHGKELSYNNIGDADGAVAIVKEFQEPCCVAVKHANPCAVAVADHAAEAYRRAHDADPVSIFGGILAFNCTVDEACAQEINRIFIEIVIAPAFTEQALTILQSKKNIRILKLDGMMEQSRQNIEFKRVEGGLLMQDKDANTQEKRTVVTKKSPTETESADLDFAMKVCKHVKSNAVVLAKDGVTVGVGGGSVSRIWAAQAAIERAGAKAKGAVMASDAYFPFDDVVRACAAAGVSALMQPGGSVNDALSVQACDETGIAMVCTGVRHFKH